MSLYSRKLWRELRRQKGQSLAVMTVTALGVFLFISSDAGYLDLNHSYQQTRAKLALADLHLDTLPLSESEARSAAKVPGVSASEARIVTALPVSRNADGSGKLELRVLTLPDSGEASLDKVLLVKGRMPQKPGEVVVEKHLAAGVGVEPGSVLTVRAPGFERALTVTGVGASAEYLWVARDENDLFPSATSFGVGWMRRSDAREIAKALLEKAPGAARGLPGITAAASDSVGNQLMVEVAPGQSEATVLRGVKRAVDVKKVVHAVREADLPGVRLLQMDVDGYKGMAAFFPLFFLGVGAFIVASVLSRLVDAQKPIIGTLLALGVSRARVLGHYVAYAAVLGGLGALTGAVLGVVSGQALTHEYAKELGIPFVTARVHWDLALAGVAMGLGVAVIFGLLPAVRASRLHPAESMRPPRPGTGPLARLSRKLRAPLPLRLAVRDVLGRPVRTLGTGLGVAAALVLVLTTGAMLDSMRISFDSIFSKSQRFDERVDLVAPMPWDALKKELSQVQGVTGSEGALTLPVELGRGDHTTEALLQGVADDAKLLRSFDVNGQAVNPEPGGIVLTHALAKKLGVRVGEVVTARPVPRGPYAQFKVTGLADAAMGPVASVRLGEAQRAFDLEGHVTTALVTAEKGHHDEVRQRLAKLPSAARVQDLASMRGILDQMMGLGWVMLGTMLLFSAVLAAAILFNTATLNIMERRRELATLRALGRSMREIAFNVTLEHALIAVLGFALGLPLAIAATRAVLERFSSDLFALPYVMSPRTVGAAAIGVVLVLLLSQWPALREVSRTPLAEAVRSREG